MHGELVVVDDVPGEFAERVVEAFLNRPGDGFALVLSGGNTARRCYERLAADGADQIDWWQVDVYWGDERCVPPDDPASNERLVREALLERVGAANAVFPMRSYGFRPLGSVFITTRRPGSASSPAEFGNSDAVWPHGPMPRWMTSNLPTSATRCW